MNVGQQTRRCGVTACASRRRSLARRSIGERFRGDLADYVGQVGQHVCLWVEQERAKMRPRRRRCVGIRGWINTCQHDRSPHRMVWIEEDSCQRRKASATRLGQAEGSAGGGPWAGCVVQMARKFGNDLGRSGTWVKCSERSRNTLCSLLGPAPADGDVLNTIGPRLKFEADCRAPRLLLVREPLDKVWIRICPGHADGVAGGNPCRRTLRMGSECFNPRAQRPLIAYGSLARDKWFHDRYHQNTHCQHSCQRNHPLSPLRVHETSMGVLRDQASGQCVGWIDHGMNLTSCFS